MTRKQRLGWLVFFILIITLVIISNIHINNRPVKGIELSVSYPRNDSLISQAFVIDLIKKTFGELVGKKRKEIDIDALEREIMKQAYIESVDSYISLGGNLKIDIYEVEPILRLYSMNNMEYYIDKHGKIIPLEEGRVKDVPVANGNFVVSKKILDKQYVDTLSLDHKDKNQRMVSQLYYLASKIYFDTLLSCQIDQFFVNDKYEIELYPKIGNYSIELDGLEDIDEKLNKLRYLYKEAFTRFGWENYSKIKLGFQGQVVCTRRNN